MEWIYSVEDPILETILGTILIFVVVIFLTRIIGLRSFAKFTAYDFAFTIAIGSIISSILTSSTSVTHGSIAIASLLALTFIFRTCKEYYLYSNQLFQISLYCLWIKVKFYMKI